MTGLQIFILLVIFTVLTFVVVITKLSASSGTGKAVRFCSQCKTEHPMPAQFCRTCGKKLP